MWKEHVKCQVKIPYTKLSKGKHLAVCTTKHSPLVLKQRIHIYIVTFS